ncbi:MAG: SRPBCC family protein [Myxococcales bacterium]|nr:SRPBCC family protein [Myxococcales bacterium]MCB9751242.1 SRPBCC family protein [Myxococcales bacterium]
MNVQHSVIIHRPLEEVFAFVTDLRNETRWQPDIRAVTLLEPIAAGATFIEERVTFGCRFTWRFRVTRFDAPHAIAIETLAGAAPYRGAREFTAVPGGTRVTETGELRLPLALRPFRAPLSRLSQRPLRQAYARLKAMLEAGAAERPCARAAAGA